MKIKAVLFDAYGTLFDVYSVAKQAEQLFPGQGERLAVLWREKQIDYTRLVSMSGRAAFGAPHEIVESAPGHIPAPCGSPFYRPFRELTRSALQAAADRLGLALTPDADAQLMDAYRRLSAYPENREVLIGLRQRGLPTGILSNGDPEMLADSVNSAGLADLLTHVISVHETRRYKTDPAAYALGPAALKLSPREILFVSSNGWDAIGATWYGYTTLWVNRAGVPLERLGTAPDHTCSSLRDVLALVGEPAA
ncbi:MAG: haloacid dehalogenase type II [Rubrivivax sp.]